MKTKHSQPQAKLSIHSMTRAICLLMGLLLLYGFTAGEAQGQKIRVEINVACADNDSGVNDAQVWIGGVFVDMSNPPRGIDRIEIDPGNYLIKASRKGVPGAVARDIYVSGPDDRFPRRIDARSRGEGISVALDRRSDIVSRRFDYTMRIDLEGCLPGGGGGPVEKPTPSASSPPATSPTGQARRTCIKTFNVSGIGKNGLPEQMPLRTEKRYYDWTDKELEGYVLPNGKFEEGQIEIEQRKYSRGGYQQIKGRTKKQDCAGYVMEQLWNTGQYVVTADRFNAVVAKFGQKISSPLGWGDIQSNDIVVYPGLGSGPGHIAIVKEVKTSSIGYPRHIDAIIIETKDGGEAVYRADLIQATKLLAEDPLVKVYGTPQIYRVDPKRVNVAPRTVGECDEPGTTTNTGGAPSGTGGGNTGTGADFMLHSDAHLSITDQSTGRRLGFNNQGGIDEDLPTGTFRSIDGVEYASIADIDRTLRVAVTGIRVGKFTLDVNVKRAGNAVAQFSYREVPVKPGTVAEVTMTPGQVSAPPPLTVTTDGRTTTVPASIGNAGGPVIPQGGAPPPTAPTAPLPAPTGPVQPGAPSSGGIGGTWVTPSGDTVILTQTGNRVTGTYRGIMGTGTLTGTFDGSTLSGTIEVGQPGFMVTDTFSLRLTPEGRLQGRVGSILSVDVILTRRP